MKLVPMLAGKAPADLSKLRFPLYASPKLDGIRALTTKRCLVSRTLKPIPNHHIQSKLYGLPEGLDGELICPGGFNATQSGVMSADGCPIFTYHIFDRIASAEVSFIFRLREVNEICSGYKFHKEYTTAVPHPLVKNVDELRRLEERYLAEGYEGVMLRDPKGPYKHGRSTTREGWLLKLKRFEDAEATVIGCIERMHNDNVATEDAFGHAKRSSHKANKRLAGDLGALACVNAHGVEFEVGTGFDAATRKELWAKRKSLIGLRFTYKHQPDPAATKESRPRFPVFLRWRLPE